MQPKEIKNNILRALEELIKNDYFLLTIEINERTLTHQLAIYLQKYFLEYHVDCEYNRNGLDKKKLDSFKKDIKSDDIEASTVYPDIIIHKRGTRDNLVVIEAKKSTSDMTNDERKLRAYKKDLGYVYAFLVKFPIKKEDIMKTNYSDLIREIDEKKI